MDLKAYRIMNDIFFEKLYNSIKDHPDEWESNDETKCTYKNKKTELTIWFYMGCCYIYRPVELRCFSWWQRRKLRKLIKRNIKGHTKKFFLKNMKIVEELIDKL